MLDVQPPHSVAAIKADTPIENQVGTPEDILTDPANDYVALFGILHRALTETEVQDFADRLAAAATDPESPITRDDIEAIISANVHQEPSDDDVRRVAGRLAEGGWPLASPVDPTQAVG